MIEFVLALATLEFILTPNHAVKYRGRIVKEFNTMNSSDQCEQYAKWLGKGAVCIPQK